MNRVLLAAAALAIGCGDVKPRGDCRTSANCPAGEYCAHTAEGSVCWPDTSPPTLGNVTVACEPVDCPRDGALVVTADATDDEEVFAVDATLDLAPGRAFPLAHGSGATWAGTIDLASVAFPWFEAEAVVTVRVRDGARNTEDAVADAGQRPVVTRVKWTYVSGASLSPPAVAADGMVVVARSALSEQLVGVSPDGVAAWTLSFGAGTVTVPPSIGEQAIWVGGNDGKLHAVKLDGSAELAARTCSASGLAKGPPAVLTTGGVDVAFGAFSNGRIYASGPTCVPTSAVDAFSSGVAIGGDGAAYAATSTATAKKLHRFPWDGEAYGTTWSVDLSDTVSAPLALSGPMAVVSGSESGAIELTAAGASAGIVSSVQTVAQSIDDSPIVLSNGDIVVGDASGLLHRIAPDGTPVEGFPVDLGAAVHAPMALTGDRLLVATFDGWVHLLGAGGAILWEGALTDGMLGAGNIHTPCDPSAAGCFSTAYFSGADGKLYAVIVEGALDTGAPWPKAWHDPRNTSRAGGAF